MDSLFPASPKNHLRPFLWYANEPPAMVCQALETLRQAGIAEAILENRGGDWFGTDRWWEMLNAALAFAQEKGMRLWLIDDSHVATGSANDSLGRPENAKYRPLNLRLDAMDWVGELHGALRLPLLKEGERLLQVLAMPVDEETGEILPEPIDLTGEERDGLLPLSLPDRRWRIYFVLQAAPEAAGFFSRYITMLNRESCRHLLREVHEKVYLHCGKYFGNAFAGFFSDEPSFGNCNGEYDFEFTANRIGELFRRILAWDPSMPARLAAELHLPERQVTLLLPALWDEIREASPRLRLAYMNVVTRLWRENFSQQLGEWCHAHGVEYIGHVLEDQGAHMRLGFGCGHFFRAMAGQDMAGWDIVLAQMIPHGLNGFHFEPRGLVPERFYQYTLPKLAASLAHHVPRMKNRALCEVMGGYGWNAGVSLMKYLFSFCLANGTGEFVPHAFSLFPPECFKTSAREKDMDFSSAPPGYCLTYMPPTYHARGFNPQYPAIVQMFHFVQRTAQLLEHGLHRPDVALYYAAEADWLHDGKEQDMDEVAAALTRANLDFDFLDHDLLCGKEARVDEKGALCLHQEAYRALVLPFSTRYPASLLRRLKQFVKGGLPVVFLKGLPQEWVEDGERGETSPPSHATEDTSGFLSCSLEELPLTLAKCRHLHFSQAAPTLRLYSVAYPTGGGRILFLNEGRQTLDLQVSLEEFQEGVNLYDPWKNRRYAPERPQQDTLRLRIAPLQLLAAEYGAAKMDSPCAKFFYDDTPFASLPLKFDIYYREVTEKEFTLLRQKSAPVNLLQEENLTRACGEYRYVTTWVCSNPEEIHVLRVHQCGDCLRLVVNGTPLPWECGPNACFDLRGLVKKGENHLELYAADSPAYADRFQGSGREFGVRLPLQPHGFQGELEFC